VFMFDSSDVSEGFSDRRKFFAICSVSEVRIVNRPLMMCSIGGISQVVCCDADRSCAEGSGNS
jgi:hypothetical protein